MADPGAIIDGVPWSWIVPFNTLMVAATACATWFYTRGGKEAVLKMQVENGKLALDAAEARSDKAIEASDVRAEKAQKAYDDLLERLHEHMIADATAFAKLEAIATETARTSVQSEVRLTQSLDKLGERIDSMGGRFDQLIDRLAPKESGRPMHFGTN